MSDEAVRVDAPEATPDAGGPSTPRAPWLEKAMLWAACAAVVVLAYSSFLGNAFQLEDRSVLADNPALQNLELRRLLLDPEAFSGDAGAAAWRPTLMLTLALDRALSGGVTPRFFHASQLAWLLLLGFVLALLFRRILDRFGREPTNGTLALLASTFFCVHVVNTGTMNVVASRGTLLAALGVASGLLIHLSSRTARRFQLGLVPALIGALADPIALMYGPLLFLWALLFERRWRGRFVPFGAFGRKVAGAFATAAIPLAAGAVLAGFGPPLPGVHGAASDAARYALSQPWSWLHYLRLFVLPVGLVSQSDAKLLASVADTRVFAGLLATAVLLVVAARWARSRETAPAAFGLLWFLACLVPTSGLVPFAAVIDERRTFLPYVGLALAAAVALRALASRLAASTSDALAPGRTAAAALGVLVLVHAVGTHVRNDAWRTEDSLLADVARKSPLDGRASLALGIRLMEHGNFEGARKAYETALATMPGDLYLAINMAILAQASKDSAEAERQFRRAIAIAPSDPAPNDYFAKWLLSEKRVRDALVPLRAVLAARPADPSASSTLLDALMAVGDDQAASDVAREILVARPDDPKAQRAVTAIFVGGSRPEDCNAARIEGNALLAKQEHLAAAVAFRNALRCEPGNADLLNNLGWCLGNAGLVAEAEAAFQAALASQPDFRLAANNLAWLRALPRH